MTTFAECNHLILTLYARLREDFISPNAGAFRFNQLITVESVEGVGLPGLLFVCAGLAGGLQLCLLDFMAHSLRYKVVIMPKDCPGRPGLEA